MCKQNQRKLMVQIGEKFGIGQTISSCCQPIFCSWYAATLKYSCTNFPIQKGNDEDLQNQLIPKIVQLRKRRNTFFFTKMKQKLNVLTISTNFSIGQTVFIGCQPNSWSWYAATLKYTRTNFPIHKGNDHMKTSKSNPSITCLIAIRFCKNQGGYVFLRLTIPGLSQKNKQNIMARNKKK